MPLSRRPLLAAAAVALICAGPATGRAQAPGLGTQLVDVMNQLWGRHPGIRANHGKGIVTEGTFVPTPAAAGLSKASIFAGGPVPVIARFSNSTGMPAIQDGAPEANPHGMGIAFTPAGGQRVDVVTNSLPTFPVATGEDFLALLKAIAASGPDAPKPTPVEQFIAAHPSVPKAVGPLKTPTSYSREIYNGVNAFIFVNADGARQAFRFRIVPDGGTQYLSPEDAAKQKPDFLEDELTQRLAQGPVKFRLLAQLANPDDQTRDSTQAWPDDRRLADMGEITLTKVAADQQKAAHDLHLLPNRLEPGIEVSDDPIIMARVQAYLISFGRRF